MSAAQTTKFQVNFKTPAGSLVNVYADTVIDGIAQMQEMLGAIPIIAEVEQAFSSGAITVPPIVNRAPVTQAAPQVAPAPAAQAPEASGRMCRHGQMKYMEQISKKTGNPYKGYFCPNTNRADQCDPQFVR